MKLNPDIYEDDFESAEWGRPGLAALVMKRAYDFKLRTSPRVVRWLKVIIACSGINRGKESSLEEVTGMFLVCADLNTSREQCSVPGSAFCCGWPQENTKHTPEEGR